MTPERNDPTRAGFTPPATGTVELSGNEVEMLCLKAARGAGLSWGLAEEAGYAAGWLHARGFDGPGTMLAHLDRLDDTRSQIALTDDGFLAADGGPICPIAAGAAISDFAALGRLRNHARRVRYPLLLLPFLHQAAVVSGSTLALSWAGGRVTVSAAGETGGALTTLSVMDEAEISIAPAAGDPPPAAPGGRAAPAAETLTRLDAYAMLTTVPASAGSRQDAGSARGDND